MLKLKVILIIMKKISKSWLYCQKGIRDTLDSVSESAEIVTSVWLQGPKQQVS